MKRKPPDGRLPRLGMLALLLAAVPASAQFLPRLDLPLGRVGELAAGLAEPVHDLADPNRLAALRLDRLRDLVRAHPRELELDDSGAPVVRGEVLATGMRPAALAAARSAGFELRREDRVEGLGLTVATLAVPGDMPARRAIRRLRQLDPAGSYEFNHIYGEAGMAAGGRGQAPADTPDAPEARIGLIDGGVDLRHPALAGLRVEQRGFAAKVVPVAHGTAVASLIAGRAPGFRGAAPGAALHVADVYGGTATGGSAAAIVRALGWMVESRVPVVNISLVGPANRVLGAAVAAAAARGMILVAAVGNDGPAAPPLYPASYPQVVAVTGVDGRDRALPEAGRARHLDFAAPGEGIAAAVPGGRYALVRGTSFAAPVVAGRLARLMPASRDAAVAALANDAVDLGRRGADPVYGKGLVGTEIRKNRPSRD